MSLDTTVSNIYAGLISDRATERRKCADSLKDLLGGTGLPNLLTENQDKSSGCTWKSFFVRIHDLIIKEAEKFESGRASTYENVKSQCTSLLFGLVAAANKSKCYVSSDTLVQCCLEILKSNRLLRAFGDSYLTLISKYIIPTHHYVTNLTPYKWADLLDISIELSSSPHVDRLVSVCLVKDIIEQGVTRCHLVLPIRDSLSALSGLYTGNDFERQHHLQENVLNIAILIIHNVAPESRLAVCEFTEAIIPHVIKFYEQTSDAFTNKKRLLFKFLHLSMTIHHPRGRFANQSGVLVKDWTLWRGALVSIHQIIKLEAAFQGNSIKRINLHTQAEVCSEFINLSIDFYHQNFNGTLQNQNDNYDDPNPPKRCRMENGNLSSLSQLIQYTTINYYPWLTITAKYMEKFAKTVSNSDKGKLLNILRTLVVSENTTLKFAAVHQAIIIVCGEISRSQWTEDYSEPLATIWSACVRKVSTDSVIFDQCHDVLQTLLDIDCFDAPLNSLLKLYSDKTVPLSRSSLRTLSLILSHYNNKITDQNVKLQITQWVLNHCAVSMEFFKDTSFVIFQLCINENTPRKRVHTDSESIIESLFDSHEYILLKSDFEDGLLVEQKCDLTEKAENTISISISEKILNHVTSHFNTSFTENIQKTSNESRCDLESSINETVIVLEFISLFGKYKVVNSSPDDIEPLLLNAKEGLDLIMSKLPLFLKLEPRSGYEKRLENTLKEVKRFYTKDNYSSAVYELICKTTSKELIECFFALIDDSDDPMEDTNTELMGIHSKSLMDTEINLKQIILDILINFCSQKSVFRDEILKYILDENLYKKFQSNDEFNLCIHIVLYITTHFTKEDVPIGSILILLQVMCQKLYRDNEASYSILTLLYGILDIVRTFGTEANRENCAIMLNSFILRCKSKYYAPKTMAQAFKCLSWIQNQSKIEGWGKQMGGILLQGLSNTIFSIRLYSCVCLGYSMREGSTVKFDELVSTLPEVFLLNLAGLTKNVVSDESANKASTVLHCLATIAVTSPVWDKKALSSLIQIACSKNISPVLLKKVFQCISQNLNIDSVETLMSDNVEFLLMSWLENELPVNDFPFYLTGCDTKENFFCKYRQILIPLGLFFVQNEQMSQLMDQISQKSVSPVENILQECLSNGLALSLPYIVSENVFNSTWNPSKKHISAGKALFVTFTNKIGKDIVNKTAIEKLVEILKNILRNVCDKESVHADLGWTGTLPFMDGPILSNTAFNSILSHLNENLKIEVIFHLCCDNPSGVQELLLHLWANIGSQHTLERRLLSLHQYWVFCHILPLRTNLDTFICAFIIHSLLHVINSHKNVENMQFMCIASCKMLHSILNKMLPDLSTLVSRFLSLIVNTVSQAALQSPYVRGTAVNLLEFLLINMKSHLIAVQTLDPLPDKEYFSKLNGVLNNICIKTNDTLYKQMENFLNGGLTGRYEGLKILHQNLKTSRSELADMFQKLKEIRGFSEDCKNSILHQLSCALIQIASDGTDREASLQACRCLGELGVSDYQTLVLQPSMDPDHVIEMSPLQYLSYTALSQLKDLFYNPDPLIAKASAKALASLLAFKEGIVALDFLTNQPDALFVKELLVPFLSQKRKCLCAKIKINDQTLDSLMERRDLWYAQDRRGHTHWVVSITSSMLKCFSEQYCFLHSFVEICQSNILLSERLLPCLIGLLHSYGSEEQINKIRANIQTFFNNYFEATFASPNVGNISPISRKRSHKQINENGSDDAPPKANRIFSEESVRCMLELVKFISVQKKQYSDSKSRIVFDYLPISWAASSTGAHFAAIYYGELWSMSSPDLQHPSNPEKISSMHHGEHILSILRKSYLAIGDNDALNGCGLAHLLNPADRKNFYMRMGSFTDALLMQDLALGSCGRPSYNDLENNDGANTSINSIPASSSDSSVISERSFVRSMQMSGLYHLAGKYTDACGEKTSLDDLKFECFWRLGDWSLQVDSAYLKSKTLKGIDSGKHLLSNTYWPAYQYISLKDSITKNMDGLDLCLNNALREARQYVVSHCMKNSLESCQSAYELATKLQILQEIEHFVEVKAKQNNGGDYTGLLKSWSTKDILPFSDFKHVEPVLAQRVIILENLSNQSSSTDLQLSIAELQLQYAELALSHDWLQAATRWISNASCTARDLIKSHSDKREEISRVAKVGGLIRMTEGKAAWCSGHHDVALHLVKTLINNGNSGDNLLYANALRLYGSWILETRSESAMDILDNYLNKSLEVLGPNGDMKAKIDTYLAIARFSDGEYKQMDIYMKSASFVNKIKCMERCRDTATSLKEKHQTVNELSRDEKKALFFNDGQGNIDAMEISNTQTERDYYLQLAIRCYLSSLCNGEDNNLCVFRVISLWLDNPTLELDSNLGKSLSEFFKCIPSRKFLPVIPQLAPRMNSVNGKPYQEIIYNVIERCLIEHPHHTLPVILALKNSNKDSEILKKTTARSQSINGDPYIATAIKMLQTVSKNGDTKLTTTIQQADTLSLALISLANLKVTAKPPEQSVPKTEQIRKLKHLSLAMVPTVTLAVRKDGKYDDIPSVVSFSEKFLLVGGVNVPKKLVCRGSDGVARSMLLKGEDDIRQDAVMQQVFIIVNHLLASNQQTRRRRLLIRTYKVVALSRRSGVIEWCEGTDPLGRLLVGADGTGGYHSRLRPQDLSAKDARKLMTDKRTATNEVKLKVFKGILARMKPVFHHFFYDNFLLPAVWYERRLAYTHSVATSSMIGYILGLGDRHVHNILIDKSSAEVIHIDFGIAFEQGRVQPTPETVPFRLTQDMVAGMGLAGIEGVFRRSCEKTMVVLKANQETLLTILEVLLCDPLYMWTISPVQAYSKQDLPTPSVTNYNTETSGSGSEAERALLRVRNKLEGVEFGTALATPGQVARLLQQATDHKNLSRLFPGWQPYI